MMATSRPLQSSEISSEADDVVEELCSRYRAVPSLQSVIVLSVSGRDSF